MEKLITHDRDANGRFTAGSEAARAAGRIGGKVSTGSFKAGSEHARSAGRKGGRKGKGKVKLCQPK